MTADHIVEGLRPLATPIHVLKPHAKNPRRGEVDAVTNSLLRFGQHRPVVARRLGEGPDGPYGEVVAGNHLVMAALNLGWDTIAVVWTDDDEQTAIARGLADNRTSDLATYDEEILAELLAEVDDLTGTGYDIAAVPDLPPEPTEHAGPKGLGSPTYGYAIVFDDEAQQKAWYGFLRWVKTNTAIPGDTIGERLIAFISTVTE